MVGSGVGHKLKALKLCRHHYPRVKRSNIRRLIIMISSTSTISNYVPLDVIDRILLRLPVNALIRFLCVSKEWSALINSSNFIKKHLNHSIETNSDRTLILNETFVNPRLQSRWFSVPYSDNDQFGKAVQIYQPLHNWKILDYCHGLVCLSFYNSYEKKKTSRFGIH